MFNVSVKVENTNPNMVKDLQRKAKEIARRKVAVGFPHGRLNAPHYESKHGGQGPSIIDVAIQNNFGIGVPRRDFMTPATEKWQEWCTEFVNAVKAQIIEGKVNVDDLLSQMGMKGADIISEEIIALKEPPNAPETIRRKGSSNPLVDSGDMSKAPTFELRTVEK